MLLLLVMMMMMTMATMLMMGDSDNDDGGNVVDDGDIVELGVETSFLIKEDLQYSLSLPLQLLRKL